RSLASRSALIARRRVCASNGGRDRENRGGPGSQSRALPCGRPRQDRRGRRPEGAASHGRSDARSAPPAACPARRPRCAKPERTARCRLRTRSEEHTSELQSLAYLVCRLLLEKKKTNSNHHNN